MTRASASNNALLLQGPIGPFFKILAQLLEEENYNVFQVAFNAGDLVSARWRNTICYNQGRINWEDWFRELVSRESITIVILFGCERFHHRIARDVCKELGIPVLALEEGYVRPGFITAEWGGNNWTSPIATLPAKQILTTPSPQSRDRKGGKNFGKVIWLGFLYYNIRALGRPFFSRAMYHKSRPVISEALKWIRNYYRWLMGQRRNARIVDKLTGPLRGKFFFVPLQVSDDQQLTAAGEGWSSDRLINELIDSFLEHADKDASLVFKLHPMERGHSNDVARVQKIARKRDAGNRILVIDDGPLGELVRVSRGMITINSTSGLSALLHHVPIAVLGKALYRRPDLAVCAESIEDIHNFWTNPESCEPEMARGVRNAIFERALIPGDYYLKAHRQAAALSIVEKLSER